MKSVHWFVRGLKIDLEIIRVQKSLARKQQRVDELDKLFVPGNCCPSCSVPGYDEATDSWARTAKFLIILLRKRAQPKDLKQARWLDWNV